MQVKRPGIGLYVFGVCAVATGMLLGADWGLSRDIVGASATLLLIAVLSEAGSHRLGVGTVTSSIAFIPLLAAIILLSPGWAMAVAGITFFISASLFRRKPPLKVAFNGSKDIIAVGISAYVYGLLGGNPSLTGFSPGIVAFGAAVVAYFALNQVTVALAIALSTGTRIREAWGRMALHLVYDISASSLAVLLAFLYVQLDLWGALLVIVPLLLVRHIYAMSLQFEQVNRDLLVLMVKSIEARDPYTSGHSVRVSRFARTMAEELGLSSKQIDDVAAAALLHDVGKIYQDFAPILRKETRLNPKEMRLMQSHPVRGADLMGTVSSLRGAVQSAVRHHHESWNGKGYPDRLKGEDIPLAARIISVVDTFDAMTSTRPYRKGLSRVTAFAELQKMSGRQFDPRLVELFLTNERMQAVLTEELHARDEAAEVPIAAEPSVPAPLAGSARAARHRWTRRRSKDTPVQESTGSG